MNASTIGILFDAREYEEVPNKKNGMESLDNYEQAAAHYGLTPCFLNLGALDIAQNECIAYVRQKGIYMKKLLPIPPVIHNRGFQLRRLQNVVIKKLIAQGIQLYNFCNRYPKLMITRILQNNTELLPYLSPCALLCLSNLDMMMRKYDDLIIKPCNGSVGIGISRIQYVGCHWNLIYPSNFFHQQWKTIRLTRSYLKRWLQQKTYERDHMIEKRIPLAQYEGRPMDVRVTVQRGEQGLWQVTGMFARVSAPHTFVSNIAQGGTPMTIQDAFQAYYSLPAFKKIEEKIEDIAIRITCTLADQLPHLADVGLDFGITEEGNIFFIECNGRDQRCGFYLAELHDCWKKTFHNPIAYGHWLIQQSDSSAALMTPPY